MKIMKEIDKVPENWRRGDECLEEGEEMWRIGEEWVGGGECDEAKSIYQYIGSYCEGKLKDKASRACRSIKKLHQKKVKAKMLVEKSMHSQALLQCEESEDEVEHDEKVKM